MISDYCSTQGPEHCHIEFCKKYAACTNNKEVFLTILRCHVREGHLQYLRNLEADLMDADQADSEPQAADTSESTRHLSNDKNDGISCELGIRYPTLQAILSGKKNVQITTVCSDSIYEIVYLLHSMI
jgi:hypothetical protein